MRKVAGNLVKALKDAIGSDKIHTVKPESTVSPNPSERRSPATIEFELPDLKTIVAIPQAPIESRHSQPSEVFDARKTSPLKRLGAGLAGPSATPPMTRFGPRHQLSRVYNPEVQPPQGRMGRAAHSLAAHHRRGQRPASPATRGSGRPDARRTRDDAVAPVPVKEDAVRGYDDDNIEANSDDEEDDEYQQLVGTISPLGAKRRRISPCSDDDDNDDVLSASDSELNDYSDDDNDDDDDCSELASPVLKTSDKSTLCVLREALEEKLTAREITSIYKSVTSLVNNRLGTDKRKLAQLYILAAVIAYECLAPPAREDWKNFMATHKLSGKHLADLLRALANSKVRKGRGSPQYKYSPDVRRLMQHWHQVWNVV